MWQLNAQHLARSPLPSTTSTGLQGGQSPGATGTVELFSDPDPRFCSIPQLIYATVSIALGNSDDFLSSSTSWRVGLEFLRVSRDILKSIAKPNLTKDKKTDTLQRLQILQEVLLLH